METRWKKIVAERACEVVKPADLTDRSAALLTEEIGPEDFISALVKAGQRLDAAKVLAYALPRREAVWWSCMCAAGMAAVSSDETEQRALAAAEKWVYQPSDEQRTAAYLSVQKCKANSGGMLCALAAAFSEEVLPIGGDQHIDVNVETFPGLVFAVIVLAADESGDLDRSLDGFLKIGEDIARGGSGKPKAETGQPAATD